MNYINKKEFQSTYIVDTEISSSRNNSRILKVQHRETGDYFAIKQIFHIEDKYSSVFFNREIDALKKLNSIDNIVKLYDSFIIEDEKVGCIVLEFVDGSNLQTIQLSSELRTNDKYGIMIDIIEAVNNAHKFNVIHRDIKPSNIMITDENKVKIIDFGISKIKDKIRTEYSPTVRDFGSSRYQAPEAREKKENIDEKSDVYSLGAVMYYLFSGNEPEYNYLELYKQVENDRDISTEIKKLIEQMIAINPEIRSNCDKILLELKRLYSIKLKNSNSYILVIENDIIRKMYKRSIVFKKSTQEVLSKILTEDFIEAYGNYNKEKNEYTFIGESIEIKCTYDRYNQIFTAIDVMNLVPKIREQLRKDFFKIDGEIIFENQRSNKVTNNKELSIKLVNHYEKLRDINTNDKIFNEVFSIWIQGLNEEIENIKQNAMRFKYDDAEETETSIRLKINSDFNYSIDELKDNLDIGIEFVYEKGKKIKRIGTFLEIEEEDNGIIIELEKKGKKINLPEDKIIVEDYRKKISAIKRQIKAILNLKDEENNPLRKILIGTAKPDSFMKSLNVEYYNNNLDSSQREAVRKALCSSAITLIQGPPGTGKTSVITEIILQILKENKEQNDNKILVVSQANRAVDNVLSKIENKISDKINIVRIGEENKIDKEIFQKFAIKRCVPTWIELVKSKSKEYMKLYLKNKNISYEEMEKYVEYKEKEVNNKKTNRSFIIKFEEKNNKLDIEQMIELFKIHQEWITNINKQYDMEVNYIKNCSIVAGTCVGFKSNPIISDSSFEYVIIDEAAKASTPELLVSLMQCSKKIIMVGDQNQLPPHLSTELEEIFRRENKKQDKSFFTTLFEKLDNNNKQLLKIQYRMNPVIGTMISKVFYGNDILNGTDMELENHYLLGKYKSNNIVWLSTSKIKNKYERQTELKSFENFSEVKIIKNELKFLDNQSDIGNYTIGIITPYSAQKKLLIRELMKMNLKNINVNEIEVNSVDAFQGSEKDIIIYSIVRNNKKKEIGFVKSKERLNVALSRAKKLIILVGDKEFISSENDKSNKYKEIVDYIQNNDNCEIIDYKEGGENE